MFLEVKRTPLVYLQHKEMDGNFIAPITSSFYINIGLVAEWSIYRIKEKKERKTLDGNNINVPIDTMVIHLEMSYTHSTHIHHPNTDYEHTTNQRYFYKLIFLPNADEEFASTRDVLMRNIAR